jgi:hypothetical protein
MRFLHVMMVHKKVINLRCPSPYFHPSVVVYVFGYGFHFALCGNPAYAGHETWSFRFKHPWNLESCQSLPNLFYKLSVRLLISDNVYRFVCSWCGYNNHEIALANVVKTNMSVAAIWLSIPK